MNAMSTYNVFKHPFRLQFGFNVYNTDDTKSLYVCSAKNYQNIHLEYPIISSSVYEFTDNMNNIGGHIKVRGNIPYRFYMLFIKPDTPNKMNKELVGQAI